MPTTLVRFGRWTVRAEPAKTRAAYTGLVAASERCGCNICKNYQGARERIFDLEARAVLDQLGIDYRREIEVLHTHRIARGRHAYEGWFHLFGAIEAGRDARVHRGGDAYALELEPCGESLSFGFTSRLAQTRLGVHHRAARAARVRGDRAVGAGHRRALMIRAPAGRVVHGDNLDVLRGLPDASIDLVYIDPPFNTGKRQSRTILRTVRAAEGGDRIGFGGKRYATTRLGERGFADAFDDYHGFLMPRLVEAHRVLKSTGSLYFHIDYREVHYCKVMLDGIFGRDNFRNEIIWAYDYGARTTKKWPAKHDNILYYAKDAARVFFDAQAVERIPYMAPELVGPEKAARGKLPTDTWWHTIVSPTGKEKLGYPTQKPLGILRRIVSASCPRGGTVLDFFAGSGTAGAAALEHGASFVLVDASIEAIAVMRRRFARDSRVVFADAGPRERVTSR
jgi:site-specific DNA-methyltransferase (adenine-specific)